MGFIFNCLAVVGGLSVVWLAAYLVYCVVDAVQEYYKWRRITDIELQRVSEHYDEHFRYTYGAQEDGINAITADLYKLGIEVANLTSELNKLKDAKPVRK